MKLNRETETTTEDLNATKNNEMNVDGGIPMRQSGSDSDGSYSPTAGGGGIIF